VDNVTCGCQESKECGSNQIVDAVGISCDDTGRCEVKQRPNDVENHLNYGPRNSGTCGGVKSESVYSKQNAANRNIFKIFDVKILSLKGC